MEYYLLFINNYYYYYYFHKDIFTYIYIYILGAKAAVSNAQPVGKEVTRRTEAEIKLDEFYKVKLQLRTAEKKLKEFNNNDHNITFKVCVYVRMSVCV